MFEWAQDYWLSFAVLNYDGPFQLPVRVIRKFEKSVSAFPIDFYNNLAQHSHFRTSETFLKSQTMLLVVENISLNMLRKVAW